MPHGLCSRFAAAAIRSIKRHTRIRHAANNLTVQAPSTSSPQLPLEIWYMIFQYLALPCDNAKLIGRFGSSLQFREPGVDRKTTTALTSEDCLFPGSAQAVWHWIMPRPGRLHLTRTHTRSVHLKGISRSRSNMSMYCFLSGCRPLGGTRTATRASGRSILA